MNSVQWRFTRDVHSTNFIRRLHQSYILPIAEYGSSVWAHRISSTDNRLEKIQRNITRNILHTAYRPHVPNYVPYLQRLRRLGMITYAHRRNIASIYSKIAERTHSHIAYRKDSPSSIFQYTQHEKSAPFRLIQSKSKELTSIPRFGTRQSTRNNH